MHLLGLISQLAVIQYVTVSGGGDGCSVGYGRDAGNTSTKRQGDGWERPIMTLSLNIHTYTFTDTYTCKFQPAYRGGMWRIYNSNTFTHTHTNVYTCHW